MTEKKSPIQERLDRYREGRPSESTIKKRRLSRIFLLVNLVLLAFVLLMVRKAPRQDYFTSNIEYDSINYRISISAGNDGTYSTSMTMQSRAAAPRILRFSDSAARVSILYNETILTSMMLGKKTRVATLMPGEIRSFVERIQEDRIKEFARENPGFLVPPRKALFFSPRQYLPLTAHVTIQTTKPLSLTIHFKYEVE